MSDNKPCHVCGKPFLQDWQNICSDCNRIAHNDCGVSGGNKFVCLDCSSIGPNDESRSFKREEARKIKREADSQSIDVEVDIRIKGNEDEVGFVTISGDMVAKIVAMAIEDMVPIELVQLLNQGFVSAYLVVPTPGDPLVDAGESWRLALDWDMTLEKCNCGCGARNGVCLGERD